MRRIVIASHKGGVAKSTTATCLAVGLARRGKRVLLCDCDAQSNATWTVQGGQLIEPPTLSDVLLRRVAAEDAIRPTSIPNLDLLPADSSLSGVNVALIQEVGRDTRLRSALAPLDGRWDVLVMDTAPSVSTILINALVAACELIVPVDASIYAVLGLVQLQEMVDEVKEAYGNRELHLAGLLLTRVTRNNVAKDVEAELRSRFPGRVYRSVIPQAAAVEAAHTRGMTVLQHAPKSPAALAYEAFIDEVMNHGDRAEDGGRGASRGRAREGDAA